MATLLDLPISNRSSDFMRRLAAVQLNLVHIVLTTGNNGKVYVAVRNELNSYFEHMLLKDCTETFKLVCALTKFSIYSIDCNKETILKWLTEVVGESDIKVISI